MADYSASAQHEWCALWDADSQQCAAPTAAERFHARTGNTLVVDGNASGAAAARYNQFLSQRVATTLGVLADGIKEASGGRALVGFYYGYIFGLAGRRLTGSGHLALAQLLAHPSVDAVVSPYDYSTEVRSPTGPLLGHVPMDTAALHGKLYFLEDDSRTVLSVKTNPHPEIHTTTTIKDTIRVLQRNLMTVGMKSCGSYLYDLDGFPGKAGWWGKPSEAADSQAIWSTVKAAREIISERMWPPSDSLPIVTATLPIEVALIVDDVSPSYFAAIGGPIPSADPNEGFSSLLHYMPAHELARAGIPYRNYLLTDLLLPAFQSDVLPTLKLVIFANALRVPASVAQYINGTLASGNRTLLWLWAPGVVKDGQSGPTLDPTGPAVITGLPLVMGAGSIPLQADIRGFAFPYFGPGDYPIAPWFSLAQSPSGRESVPVDVEVLARYHSNHRAAMIRAKRANHCVIFSGAIKIPTELYTKIAFDAGCHVYIKTAEDIVETGGQVLMVVAGDPKLSKAKRTVTLPTKVAKVEDGSGLLGGKGSVSTLCEECAAFDTATMAPGDVALFFITPTLSNTTATSDGH